MNQKLTVKDVMSKPVSIAKSGLIPEALDKMLAEGVDPIVVTNDRVVVGTASRRSIAEKMGSKKTGNIPASQIRVASVTREDFTSVYQDQDVDLLVPLLQRYKIVVVWDEEHRLIGQVTTGDLLKVAKPEGSIDTMVEIAPRISPDDRVVQLHRRMVGDGATRFIVMDGNKAVGIVTETDIAKILVKLKSEIDKHFENALRNVTAADIMSSPLITTPANTPVSKVVDLMLAKNISTIPIADGDKVIGLATRKSLVDAL
ncbi:CBS domain-containing protein [Methanocorpusculum sp. MG]|uniref:CBS domain-containing protein n=1 Tax=Methanocorpusculum petauri TaxID=3002863 RepID=A0ABT4IFZ9_9EURY|nr:CBS domain-containing protein [Methanocorpusculum petauri]MCZ0860657.1 CBS domain-containing protein [Methanocorpusculum petauri]MDE2443476.1 CBS domain-containing protein [Methanocorpusculum sp.]